MIAALSLAAVVAALPEGTYTSAAQVMKVLNLK